MIIIIISVGSLMDKGTLSAILVRALKWMTIKNDVLDYSCSITNAYSSVSGACVRGTIGYYNTTNGNCIIENSVNMTDVTFS